jgi:hypothetical protein
VSPHVRDKALRDATTRANAAQLCAKRAAIQHDPVRNTRRFAIIGDVKFLRMKPGHGEVVIAEGDPEVTEEERELIEAFREQLDNGMWAAVPLIGPAGRRQAQMVKAFDEIPRDADRVIFFPRAAGGR